MQSPSSLMPLTMVKFSACHGLKSVIVEITDDERAVIRDFTMNSNIRISRVKPE